MARPACANGVGKDRADGLASEVFGGVDYTSAAGASISVTALFPLPASGTLDSSIPSSRRRPAAGAFEIVSRLLVHVLASQLVGSASQQGSYDSDLAETESRKRGPYQLNRLPGSPHALERVRLVACERERESADSVRSPRCSTCRIVSKLGARVFQSQKQRHRILRVARRSRVQNALVRFNRPCQGAPQLRS